MSLEEFVSKSKDIIIEGRNSIITLKKVQDKIKKEKLRIYIEKLRWFKEIEKDIKTKRIFL